MEMPVESHDMIQNDRQLQQSIEQFDRPLDENHQWPADIETCLETAVIGEVAMS